MNRVIHFELPATDMSRVQSFYGGVFGWQLADMGAEMGHYVLAATAESDERGPKQPGAINGGIFPADGSQPAVPSFVIEVDDLHAHIAKVQAAGGTVTGEPQTIPGVGLLAMFSDTEGNRLSMLQPER